MKLVQDTQYPWSGEITLTITPDKPRPFTLNLRLPAWCDNPNLSVNQKSIGATSRDHGYVSISREWKPGDVVTLDLNIKPHRVYADPNVSADKGRVAIQYGPLVYCAEAADNPDVRLSALYLPTDATITPEPRPDLLGGITVLKTRAKLLSADSNQPKDVDLTLIPYYAWDQRTPGPMAVWLAEDPSVATPAPIPTLANTSRASASHVNLTDTVDALSDAAPIASSGDQAIPRFTWWDRRGSAEWVQYDFPNATTVSSADVYFFDDTKQNGRCRLPKSWRLLYKDGDAWKPIEATYPVLGNQFNSVKFTPVETKAVRLEAQLRPEFSAGILEWRLK